ncbi:MAG: nucleoside monophosphate kinase [Candidatus Taylorbacteria bacterium]
MKPQSFIFMGRYGSGKGTQSQLLIDALKKRYSDMEILYVQTGQEFRNYFATEHTYTSQLSKKTVESGALMPEFMCVYMWGRLIAEKFKGHEHLVFDGTPRKLMEAHMLEPLFAYYGLEKPWVIYLDVEHEEAIKRLSVRARTSGRVDDGEEQLKERKLAYEADIIPSIEYYRTSPHVRFLDIDGERSIAEIHADILKKIGL